MNIAIHTLDGQKLTLDFLLGQLQRDGIISAQQLAQLDSQHPKNMAAVSHPLVVIAEQDWQSITEPGYPLSLEE